MAESGVGATLRSSASPQETPSAQTNKSHSFGRGRTFMVRSIARSSSYVTWAVPMKGAPVLIITIKID